MRLFRRLLVAALLLLASGLAHGQDTTADNSVFRQIDSILAQLSEITGLEMRRRVDYAVIAPAELKQFLKKRIREEIDAEQIRIEELLLEKLGFVPKDFHLEETTLALYEEQAAAFYDFRQKKLFLLDSSDGPMQRSVLVHELAHALADQHFHLERFIGKASKNDDAALARMAVMEGQATWLMTEFMARRMGESLADSRELVDMMSRLAGAPTGQFPVLDKAPLYVRQSLLFPYTSGLEFQQAVFEKLGRKSFTQVFRRPPRSTRQVLHPEKYFHPDELPPPRLPRISGGFQKSAEGTLGEFDFGVLLEQYGSEHLSRSLAPQWRAGRYRLWEKKDGGHVVLLHGSVWATREAASRFFQFYRRVLAGKWDRLSLTAESPSEYAGEGDDGRFVVRLLGTAVYAVEGLRSGDVIRKWPKPSGAAARRRHLALSATTERPR